MTRIRKHLADPRRSRHRSFALAAALLSVVFLLAGIGMDMANRSRSEPMATLSLVSEAAGLASGVTAFVIRRLD